MKTATTANLSADLIKKLRDCVRQDMGPHDITALELLDHLEIAWCAAERWRIEQWDPEFEHGAGEKGPRHLAN